MRDPFRRPSLGSGVFYKDPWAALDWLEKAFGFERTMVISDKEGHLGHAEMRFGDGYIMVGAEWAEFIASPASVGGKNTQSIQVHLTEGIELHYERARGAGAVIQQGRPISSMAIAPIALAIRRAMCGPLRKAFAACRVKRPSRLAD